MTWVLDLDGVVWLGDQPIPGSAEAVTRLRDRGERVVVVTNNSAMTIGAYETKLARTGVPTAREDIVTSAQVAAGMIRPDERVLVCAGEGVREALSDRAIEIVDDGDADVVVVGWTQDFDYAHLTRAMRAVRGGARLLGTNDDATYPTPDGVLPGGGSLVAAVAYASGVPATFAGKPHPPMVEAVKARFGSVDVMVGDRPSTDGLLARGLGARFALVLSGVTKQADLPVEPAPDLVAADLAGLVEANGGT